MILKKGDLVRCVNKENVEFNLQLHQIYRIREYVEMCDCYRLEGGDHNLYAIERFKKIHPSRLLKILLDIQDDS